MGTRAIHRFSGHSVEERFWAKVNVAGENDCWEWTADTSRHYGRFGVTATQKIRAHRFSWSLVHGPIPDGMCVLHSCDNPPCVNPAHLSLGTQAENIADRDAKGRAFHKARRQ